MSHVYIAALRHPLRAAKEFATLDLLVGRAASSSASAPVTSSRSSRSSARDFLDRGKAPRRSHRRDRRRSGRRVPRARRARAGRRPVSGLAPVPSSAPVPRSGWAVRRRPALRGRGTRGDGWLPQTAKRAELQDQVAELLEFRQELRDGAPIAIGALAGIFHVGAPAWELPRGTVSGSAGEDRRGPGRAHQPGVCHIQLRFPSRSVDEMCDQMAAFGEQVAPLLTR